MIQLRYTYLYETENGETCIGQILPERDTRPLIPVSYHRVNFANGKLGKLRERVGMGL